MTATFAVSEREWIDVDPEHFEEPTRKREITIESEQVLQDGPVAIEAELTEDAADYGRERGLSLCVMFDGEETPDNIQLYFPAHALPRVATVYEQLAAVIRRLSDEAIARDWGRPLPPGGASR